MNYKIETIPSFDKQLKNFNKKYVGFKNDFSSLAESLKTHPTQGNSIGKNCFKVRLKISAKNKGKSGGARIITYVYIQGETVYLLAIYDKSEQDSISSAELKLLLKELES